YRYGMAVKATQKRPRIHVSDIELCLPGPSYTLTTVRKLNEWLGDQGELYFIGGTDILFDLPNWYKPNELLKECKLLIGTRPGYPEENVTAQVKFLSNSYGADISLFAMPPQNISSTEIRRMIYAGGLKDVPVPKKVKKFIKQYDVYGDRLYLDQLQEDTLEKLFYYQQLMWRRMSFFRLLHSVSTAMTALRLACRFGADPDKTVVAAMLHDISKERPDPKLLQEVSADAAWWTGYPAVMHGPMGAAYVRSHLKIEDVEILDAISHHTILRPEANLIEKIVFLSDKIEPGRKFKDLDPIKKAAATDLDRAVYLCIKAVNRALRLSHAKPHPYSVAAERHLASLVK
ncbi:MAG TPA: HD domain-containing protein, partial [Clostridiaceae bacterium]|nr:HD domain-containing protein [Clostridiaceae bacterium]